MREEKTYIENGYASVLKIKSGDKEYLKGVCLSPTLAYDLLEDEYCDSFEDVPIFGAEEDKELLDKLKNPPQSTAFDDNFAKEITEAGIKAAKASHRFKMLEIRAQLLADCVTKLIGKSPTRYDIVQIAEDANKLVKLTLGKL